MDNMEYLFMVHTWGGFYNEEHRKIHGAQPGNHYFSTADDRDSYVLSLRAIEDRLNARVLVVSLSEGYNCRTHTTLHRVSELRGKRVYSTDDMGANYPYGAASYHMENKWYLGFNDYPFGEDINYTKVKVIQEWITGAFVPE